MDLNLNLPPSQDPKEPKKTEKPPAQRAKKTAKKVGRPRKYPVFEGKTYGILVVDDEKSWQNVYKINLFKQINQDEKRFVFYEASNGKEAIKVLAQYYDRIQVMIVDLKMDKMSGMELLKCLVDQLGLSDLGIFIVTAYGTKEDLEEAQIRGVRGFIDKSQLDFERLSYLICAYLDLSEKEKATDLGIYAESRLQYEQRYLYLRWKYSNEQWENMYVGNINEIETLTLPNLKTKLENLEGLIPPKDTT